MKWTVPPPSLGVDDCPTVAVDFETGQEGSEYGAPHRVLSVGVARFEKGKMVTEACWDAFVSDAPEPRDGDDTVWVNGIDAADLAGPRSLPGREVFERLAADTEGAVVVAHRLPFEVVLWGRECWERALSRPQRHGACSKLLAWGALGKGGLHSGSADLARIAVHFGLDLDAITARLPRGRSLLPPGPHNALWDAAVCGELALEVMRRHGGDWNSAHASCAAWAEFATVEQTTYRLAARDTAHRRMYEDHLAGRTVEWVRPGGRLPNEHLVHRFAAELHRLDGRWSVQRVQQPPSGRDALRLSFDGDEGPTVVCSQVDAPEFMAEVLTEKHAAGARLRDAAARRRRAAAV